jgi:hypothetical protein
MIGQHGGRLVVKLDDLPDIETELSTFSLLQNIR